MKWTDLEPGDKIRVSKEAKKAFPNLWLSNWWYNEILEVATISQDDFGLCISIKDLIGYTEAFYLSSNGQYNSIGFFEIVELKKD